MSDEASSPAKRGLRSAAKTPDKRENNKKRQRKEVKQAESGDEDGATAPKRGRGRPPKGSKKRKSPYKPKGKSGPGQRGRPRKDEKKKDSEDEDYEENDGSDDQDD